MGPRWVLLMKNIGGGKFRATVPLRPRLTRWRDHKEFAYFHVLLCDLHLANGMHICLKAI
jgi:hypothetical protein